MAFLPGEPQELLELGPQHTAQGGSVSRPGPPLPHEWCRQGESWRSFWNSGWGRPSQGRHPGLDFAWLGEKNRHGKKTSDDFTEGWGIPRAKCQMWAYVTVSSILKMRKLEAGNHVSGYESPNAPSFLLGVFFYMCIMSSIKKWTNTFEFTLSWLLCSANKSSSLFTTPLSPLWTWPLLLLDCYFIALLLITSVLNLHGLSVQSEDSLKDSFSESSNFNNCSLSLLLEAPLSHALSCLLLKTWELRRPGIVTHLQIWTLLAEVPHLEGAGHGARVPDLSAGLTPAWAQLLVPTPSWRPASQLPHCGLNEIMYMKCKPK